MTDIRDTYKWRKLRAAILARDLRTCHYCGETATTVDHLVPLSKGGAPYDPDNLVAACMRCNYSKKNKTSAVFLTPQPQIGRAHV